MATLRDIILDGPSTWLAVSGFVIGFAFGVISQLTNFCTLGAISDWRLFGDRGRLGAFALAAATAIIGAQTLDALSVAELSKSIYLMPHISWLSAISGGLLFGVGMVYAGGCPSRALIRAGSGDLRALVTLFVVATAAFASLSGIFATLRMSFQNTFFIDVAAAGAANAGATEILHALGVSSGLARILAAASFALPLLYFALGPAHITARQQNVIAGLGIGLLATFAWLATSLASDDLAANPIQPMSLSFVRPVAEAFDWIERSTALGLPGFAAASILGSLLGSFVSAMWRGTVHSLSFADPADFKRHILGAAAMGAGGVMSFGCSIGQGVAGLSTLSIQSLIATVSIFAGVSLGLKWIDRSV